MIHLFTPYIYILIFLVVPIEFSAQILTLEISTKDSVHSQLLKDFQFKKKHSTEASLQQSIDSIIRKFESFGFLNAQLDSVVKTDNIRTIVIDLNTKIDTIRVYYDSKELKQKVLPKYMRDLQYNYFDVEPEQLSQTLKAIASAYESEGRSFTGVYLTNIVFVKGRVEAMLEIERSEIRKMDKIIINGFPNFPKNYIRNYFGLDSTTVVTEKKMNEVSNLSNNLMFASEVKPPEILFTKDSTSVYLYLQKKKSNRFDGVLGFNSKENGRGLAFNGYIDLLLNNLFNSGENFSIYWKNNGGNRQFFTTGLELPFVLNSRFSPKFNLNVYKQDSSFVNTKLNFSLLYSINSRTTIGTVISNEISSKLPEGIEQIENFKNLFYGLTCNLIKPDNTNLFQAKFGLLFEALTGKREYEGDKNRQYKLFFNIYYLWSLNEKNHLFIQNNSSTLISNKTLFTNEMFRLGGTSTIRGFNEESIFASTYSYFNIEYRYITVPSSYLYTITDFGYLNNELVNNENTLYSLGLGYTFLSKIGEIDLSYAIGKFGHEPIKIENSRFHIKIINYF